jgi:hypothetical protein
MKWVLAGLAAERGTSLRDATGTFARAAITATDGPFTEAKEVIGGFGLINAKDRAEAVEYDYLVRWRYLYSDA